MAKHTKKNLKKDVENAAAKLGVKGHAMHAATKDLDLKNGGVSYQKTEPGHKTPFGHYHKEQEEIYVIIGGSGRIKLDDEVIELAHMDAVRVPKEVTRQIEAGSDGIEFIVFGSPVTGNDRGEIVPDWWTE